MQTRNVTGNSARFTVGVTALALMIVGCSSSKPRNEVWSRKALASEIRAATLAGFDADEKRLYHLGLQHIYNRHEKLGSYTIAQVIDQERSREASRSKQKSDLAAREKRAADERRVAADRAAAARTAAVEANYVHGTPDCLVLDKRTLRTVSGEYSWYIVGKVTNRCDRDLGYAQVTFSFYDASGNLENSGIVNVNNLNAGDTWAFKKMVYETNSGSGTWRVQQVSGF